MGRTLAFTSTRLTHPTTGKLLAQGTHTKYIRDALADKEGRNVTFDEAGDDIVSDAMT
jgi:acyl-coenzyme A thioesterase 13